MKYIYYVQSWKDGSPRGFKECQTKKEAMKAANAMMGGKCGYTCEAVDIVELDEELRTRSKTCFYLVMLSAHFGKWEKEYQYIGEDE